MSLLSVAQGAKALIFDIDGTLVDTMPTHLKSYQMVCNDHGFSFSEDFFYEMAGLPTHKVLELWINKLKLNFDGIKLAQLKEVKFFELINEIKPLEIVVDIALENYGEMPMSLGTGGTKVGAAKTIEAVGLTKYFDIVVTCEDVVNPKPSPDTFLLCAEKMGIEPQFCQVFEDGEPGLEAARAAGMIATDIRPFIKRL